MITSQKVCRFTAWSDVEVVSLMRRKRPTYVFLRFYSKTNFELTECTYQTTLTATTTKHVCFVLTYTKHKSNVLSTELDLQPNPLYLQIRIIQIITEFRHQRKNNTKSATTSVTSSESMSIGSAQILSSSQS